MFDRKLLLALAVLATAHSAQARRLGSIEFTPCTLSMATAALTVEAQCATLKVAENRADPQSRQIELALAWVPAKAADAAADPVFMLAGGPGQSALESYPQVANAFREVHKRRHVILVDQRGTGKSHPLMCKNSKGEGAVAEDDESAAALSKFAQDCAASLDADPRFYSTSEAVQDLDQVRAALQAEQIDLVGISYGTRVAQTYLKRYPEHTRAVVIDGVVPQTLVLGSDHAKNLESALDLNFARCEKDPVCKQRFGSPRANLEQLFAQARAQQPLVSFRDPQTNEVRQAKFDAGTLGGVVRLYAYAPVLAAMLPMGLSEAAHGKPEILMAQAQMLRSVLGESIMHGMQLSVLCTEDTPLLKADPADANTTIGNALIDLAIAQCAVWPHNEMPAGFHDPVASDKPVLLLSGEFDPVTPPRYADEVVKTLPNGRHLIARGAGHNVIGVGCLPKLFGEFLQKADAKGLDTKCLDELSYAPPFAGYYGWEP